MSLAEIDAVLDRLRHVVDETRVSSSRAGFFASMYRKVTFAVREAIVAGRFRDGDRMARLDRIFAERYLDAYAAWRDGDRPSASWRAAFDATERWRPIIIQHLLLGMSTHINLDLGVAAATVAPGAELARLRPDFDTINEVLAELTDGFIDDVAEVSPWIGLLGRIGGRTDEVVVRFSIEVARRQAWVLAERLAATPSSGWAPIIDDHDQATAKFAKFILRPGPFLPSGLLLIRLRESNDTPYIIDVLGDNK